MLQDVQLQTPDLCLDAHGREILDQLGALHVPGGGIEETKGAHLKVYLSQHRYGNTGHLAGLEMDVLHSDERGIKLTPEGGHGVEILNALLYLSLEILDFFLDPSYLETKRTLLTLDRREDPFSELEILLLPLEGGLVVLKLYSHTSVILTGITLPPRSDRPSLHPVASTYQQETA